MLKKYQTHISLLTLVSAGLIWTYFWSETQLSSRPKDESILAPSPADTGNRARAGAAPPVDNGSSDAFYRTIIDNNLFRPLGWTPPDPVPPYRLIGTILPKDERIAPKAVIQTKGGDSTYIVSPGEKIGDATEVVEIQTKQVTLSIEGEKRTLRLKPLF